MSLGVSNIIFRTVSDALGTTMTLDLNDGVKYVTEFYNLGQPEREETWIHPDAGFSYLARKQDRPTKMAVELHVLGSQFGAGGASSTQVLRTNVMAVRDSFQNVSNFIEIGLGGTKRAITALTRVGTTATMTTQGAHGMVPGDTFMVRDVVPDNYNNSYVLNSNTVKKQGFTAIAPTSGSTVTYTIDITGAPATPATRRTWMSPSNVWSRFRTYPTAINPTQTGDPVRMAVQVGQNLVVSWLIEIWRDPYPINVPVGDSNLRGPVL